MLGMYTNWLCVRERRLRGPSCEKAPGWISSTLFRSIISCFSEESPSNDSWIIRRENDEMHAKVVQVNATRANPFYLVQDLNLVVGQVKKDQPAKSAESSFPNSLDVAVLQRQMGEVRYVCERPCRKLQQVISSQVQFHCYLGDIKNRALKQCKSFKRNKAKLSH